MSIAVYKPEDTRVHINGIEIEPADSFSIDNRLLSSNWCKCGKESDFGCHGVKNSEVYSEYYCKECYHKEHE